MSDEVKEMIKECEKGMQLMNETSKIIHCDTIAQYKILQWINENFVSGSVFLSFTDTNRATIKDNEGNTMNLAYVHSKGVYEE